MDSSLTEHPRKCLKVEYFGRIQNDFQKSLVTGPWDHKVLVSAKKFNKKFHACVPLRDYEFVYCMYCTVHNWPMDFSFDNSIEDTLI